MGISAIEAGKIANAHGLSLSDAVALQKLSNSTSEAEAFAAEFTGTAQLTRDDLAGMKPSEIEAARKAGKCQDLLNPPKS